MRNLSCRAAASFGSVRQDPLLSQAARASTQRLSVRVSDRLRSARSAGSARTRDGSTRSPVATLIGGSRTTSVHRHGDDVRQVLPSLGQRLDLVLGLPRLAVSVHRGEDARHRTGRPDLLDDHRAHCLPETAPLESCASSAARSSPLASRMRSATVSPSLYSPVG